MLGGLWDNLCVCECGREREILLIFHEIKNYLRPTTTKMHGEVGEEEEEETLGLRNEPTTPAEFLPLFSLPNCSLSFFLQPSTQRRRDGVYARHMTWLVAVCVRT